MTTYDPKIGIVDQASDALIEVIALFKAAGWSEKQIIDTTEALWDVVPKAKPAS